MNCPICGHVLLQSDDAGIPQVAICLTGCRQYKYENHGLGDGILTIGGETFMFSGYYPTVEEAQASRAIHVAALEEAKRKWGEKYERST